MPKKLVRLKKPQKWVLMKLLSPMRLLITIWNNIYKMKWYCLNCTKDTENINPRASNISNGRTMVLSKCAISGSKKSIFIKDQEAKGLFSNLGVRAPLSKVIFYGFKVHVKSYKNEWNS